MSAGLLDSHSVRSEPVSSEHKRVHTGLSRNIFWKPRRAQPQQLNANWRQRMIVVSSATQQHVVGGSWIGSCSTKPEQRGQWGGLNNFTGRTMEMNSALFSPARGSCWRWMTTSFSSSRHWLLPASSGSECSGVTLQPLMGGRAASPHMQTAEKPNTRISMVVTKWWLQCLSKCIIHVTNRQFHRQLTLTDRPNGVGFSSRMRVKKKVGLNLIKKNIGTAQVIYLFIFFLFQNAWAHTVTKLGPCQSHEDSCRVPPSIWTFYWMWMMQLSATKLAQTAKPFAHIFSEDRSSRSKSNINNKAAPNFHI